jgi:hypothetical protein
MVYKHFKVYNVGNVRRKKYISYIYKTLNSMRKDKVVPIYYGKREQK